MQDKNEVLWLSSFTMFYPMGCIFEMNIFSTLFQKFLHIVGSEEHSAIRGFHEYGIWEKNNNKKD
jgi:hypothetical protein